MVWKETAEICCSLFLTCIAEGSLEIYEVTTQGDGGFHSAFKYRREISFSDSKHNSNGNLYENKYFALKFLLCM